MKLWIIAGLMGIIFALIVTRPSEQSMEKMVAATIKKQKLTDQLNTLTVKEKIANRTAKIKARDMDNMACVGSGTLVSSNGYILSVAHIVEYQTKQMLTVTLHDGREFSSRGVTVVDAEPAKDLLLLKLPAPMDDKYDFSPILESETAYRLAGGELLYLAGNAYGLTQTLITDSKYIGLIMADDGGHVWLDWFNAPGDSGGGVYTQKGSLLAVFHGVKGYDGFSRISQAIANHTIRAFLDKNHVPYETSIEIE